MRSIGRAFIALIAIFIVGAAVALAFVDPPAPEPRTIERPVTIEEIGGGQ